MPRLLNMRLPVALPIVAILLVLGCPPRAFVSVEGSSVEELTFVISASKNEEVPIGFGVLVVSTCGADGRTGDNVYWKIAEEDPSSKNGVVRVRYGVTPSGFKQLVPPRAINKGCLDVTTLASGGVSFLVDDQGGVSLRSGSSSGP